MADVGEERGNEVGRELDAARARLVALIAATPSLDWLLLTKRPAAFRRAFPPALFTRSNVWPGVTVEHADVAPRRAHQARVGRSALGVL